MIRRARDQWFDRCIQGDEEIYEPLPNIPSPEEEEHDRRKRDEENERCWTVLHYTKEWATTVTPALYDSDCSIAVTVEEKEEMIRSASSTAPPVDTQKTPASYSGTAYKMVTEKILQQALYQQYIKKAPGPDQINFCALWLLWKWDLSRIINLIQQCVKQCHYPHVWRISKGILLCKPSKIDYTQFESYRIISLLNLFGKVAEKVVAELLSD